MIDIQYFIKYPVDSFSVLVKLFPIAVILWSGMYRQKVYGIYLSLLSFQFIIGFWMIALASVRSNNLVLYNIYVYFGFGISCTMFYYAYSKRVSKKLLLTLASIFYIVATYDIINVGSDHSLRFAGTLECLFTIIFVLAFYKELLTDLKVKNLFRYAFFYVASGILVFTASNTFLSPVFYYIDTWNGPTGFDIHILLPAIMESFYLIFVGVGFLVSKS